MNETLGNAQNIYGAAGSNVTPLNPMTTISAAGVGHAEGVSWYKLGPNNDFFKNGVTTRLFSIPWIVQAWVRVGVRDAAAGSFTGIQIGSFESAPPYPNPDPTHSVIQLRINEDPANYRFELCVNDSTGAGAQAVAADLAGRIPAQNFTYHFMIAYQPGQYVSGYVDGILVNTITATLPEQLGLGRFGLGIFCACNTAGQFETAAFAGGIEQCFLGT